MKTYKKIIALLTLCMVAVLLVSGCTAASTAKMKVVTSTSLLGYITDQVGGDRVEVINLIPPVQHPGNFNVRPGDVQTLASSKLFLVHGWPGEGFVDQFVEAANNPELVVYKASVDGNWMTPSVQSAAADKVAAALGQVDSQNAATYEKNAAEYKARVAAKEIEIKSRLTAAGVSNINVIASERQLGFLKWSGFNVVANYAGPNALNPQLVKELVDQGREASVTLVIDNLQDGKDAGRGIAEDIGATQLNLSNFPGGFENTETWEKAIDRNIDLLLEAIGK
jgi:zinc transport system substrate-binding protein